MTLPSSQMMTPTWPNQDHGYRWTFIFTYSTRMHTLKKKNSTSTTTITTIIYAFAFLHLCHESNYSVLDGFSECGGGNTISHRAIIT